MPKYWFSVLGDALVSALQALGSTKLTPIYLGITGALGFGLWYYTHRGLPLQTYIGRLAVEVFGVGALAFVPFFLFYLAAIPYRQLESQKQLATSSAASVAALKETLALKRHAIDPGDPAYQNMEGIVRAFQGYRRAIGNSTSHKLLITGPPTVSRFRFIFTSLAVLGSGIGNGDLLNIGVLPEHVEAEESRGLKDGSIVLHALPGMPGVDSLVTDLSNLVPISRSYEMPAGASSGKDVIWFQLGPGIQWNTERHAKG